MDALGIVDHEGIGARWLAERGFSETVCTLVSEHVSAKRYQVYKRAAYRQALSPASLGTLAFQGGAMAADEAEAFEAHPLFQAILAVRSWDERAKVPNLVVPSLDDHRARMRAHLSTQRGIA
jgi:predicted HD phosphohydrolase